MLITMQKQTTDLCMYPMVSFSLQIYQESKFRQLLFFFPWNLSKPPVLHTWSATGQRDPKHIKI